jgi:hypothetical protein
MLLAARRSITVRQQQQQRRHAVQVTAFHTQRDVYLMEQRELLGRKIRFVQEELKRLQARTAAYLSVSYHEQEIIEELSMALADLKFKRDQLMHDDQPVESEPGYEQSKEYEV